MNNITSSKITEELKGQLSVQMANNLTLDDLCTEYIPDYNRDRFEAFTIRILVGKETFITIYAVDKVRQEDSTAKENKLAVKKFKLDHIDLSSIFSYCNSFNCTLSTGNYEIEDMDVKNK